jgi:CrcB protein
MLTYLLVAVGGAIGSVARYWFSGVVATSFGGIFPWGTLLVNISGSFAIGLIFGLTDAQGRWMASPNTRTFLMIGICGGYTTFSSFSLQTLNLMRDGEMFKAGANCLASVALCLFAVWLGYVLALTINSTKGS